MSISISAIELLAKLAKLDLNEAEKKKYQKDISKILEYVEKIQFLKIDPSNSLLFNSPLKPNESCREDKIENFPELGRQAIIQAFPAKEGNLNKVKAVFEE